jgi:hypothetical protein
MYDRIAAFWTGASRRTCRLAWGATILLFNALALPAVLNAGALTGTLVLSSHGTETVAVNGVDIDFDFSGAVTTGFPPEAVNPALVDGTGDSALFDITAASTGSFAGITGDTVTIHDLNSTQEPVGTTVGPSLPLTTFLAFNAPAPAAWGITLTELLPGVDGSAGCSSTAQGAICSLANSPFNLQNEAGNEVLVGFSFLGTATDGMGNTSNVSGTFSTTLSNTNIQAIVTAITGGQAVVSSATGSLAVTAIPEPGSFGLLFPGILLLTSSVMSRRLRRR